MKKYKKPEFEENTFKIGDIVYSADTTKVPNRLYEVTRVVEDSLYFKRADGEKLTDDLESLEVSFFTCQKACEIKPKIIYVHKTMGNTVSEKDIKWENGEYFDKYVQVLEE